MLMSHLTCSLCCVACIITAVHLAAISTPNCRAPEFLTASFIFSLYKPAQIGYLIIMTMAGLEGTNQKFIRLSKAHWRQDASSQEQERDRKSVPKRA